MISSNETCSICLEEFSIDIAKSIPCSHTFCSPCINEWITKKTQCPLCAKIITQINFLHNGEVSHVLNPPRNNELKTNDENKNFDCFDHAYFLKEYNKLLKKANELEFAIKSNRKSYDSGSWHAYENLKHDINCKIKMMRDMKKYDANHLLQDIIVIDSTIKKIHDGEFETNYYDNQESYYDYDDDYNEDYDYDYDNDEYDRDYAEIQVDAHLANYVKKNNINMMKFGPKNFAVVDTTPKKKKKEKKTIKAQR